MQACASLNLAVALLEAGRPAEATEQAHAALVLALRATEHEVVAYALGTLAAGLGRIGEATLAARLAGAADESVAHLGLELQPLEARQREATLAALCERVGAATFDAERSIGRHTAPEQALQLVAQWAARRDG